MRRLLWWYQFRCRSVLSVNETFRNSVWSYQPEDLELLRQPPEAPLHAHPVVLVAPGRGTPPRLHPLLLDPPP